MKENFKCQLIKYIKQVLKINKLEYKIKIV